MQKNMCKCKRKRREKKRDLEIDVDWLRLYINFLIAYMTLMIMDSDACDYKLKDCH